MRKELDIWLLTTNELLQLPIGTRLDYATRLNKFVVEENLIQYLKLEAPDEHTYFGFRNLQSPDIRPEVKKLFTKFLLESND
jgi:hypothetical protein